MNTQTPSTPHDSSSLLRMVLWSVLVLGAAGNMVASTAAAGLTAHLVLGTVTAVAAAGLVALWLRARP